MKPRIEITEDITTCLELRRLVFIEEQDVSEADERDELDPHCLHLLAFHAQQPVGTARIYIREEIAKIGRVCVLQTVRGTGLGGALIRKSLAVAKANGARQAKLGAQLHALGFYEALGFTAYGPTYDDAGIAHQDMVQEL
ncbi:MAG: GNAT family N-acetyltransferase [Pseudomonadota bacterium]